MLTIFVGFNDVQKGSVCVFRLYTQSTTSVRLKEIVDTLRKHLFDRFVESRGDDRKISLIALEAGHHLYDVILKDGSPKTDLQFMFEDDLIESDQNFQMWFPEEGMFDLELSFWTNSRNEYSDNVSSHIYNGVFSIRMNEEGSEEILNEALMITGVLA
jgi:hypothetical protein